jgi:hypothetical protein
MSNLDQTINNESNNHPFRLIVHIGIGKTGTTSIQNVLARQQKSLIEQGVWYLGLMLEQAPVKLYSWQKSSAIEELMSLDEDKITTQLIDVLTKSIDIIIDSGCRTAILSNESFFDRPKAHTALIRAFEILAAKGWQIDIVVYIRRHDDWLKSAYIQWGLIHKTYKGKLLPFSEWIKNFPFLLVNSLNKWASIKGCKCIVRNFDAVINVVEDFYSVTGIHSGSMENFRDNQAPLPEELLLRSLFNNQIHDTALPFEFNRLMDIEGLNFTYSATTFLSNYLPTHEELNKVFEDCAEDREEINRILNDNDQPPLGTSPLKIKPIDVDLAKLTAVLFQIVANQARKIEILESKISKITASDN